MNISLLYVISAPPRVQGEAQLLLEALSKCDDAALAAAAGSGDETKVGGGADAASGQCRTAVTKPPKRFQKGFLAKRARNSWRTMTGLLVKTVSTPFIPYTSEFVALGPSTAASAQQSPSAAASSLPSQVFSVFEDQYALVSLTIPVVICLLYSPGIGGQQGTTCTACPSCFRTSIKWLSREKKEGTSAGSIRTNTGF